MHARDRYRDAAAFRRALEQRLRTEAQKSRIPLNRLRKEAAFNRLLVRLSDVAPTAWALKGGLALIARVGAHVRGTKDADANWRASLDDLEDALTDIEDADVCDWFTFNVGDARPLQGEGDEGALRYPVTATLDGRVFEQLSLDVNVLSPDDRRPIELVTVRRNPFDFTGAAPLTIPMVTPAQQLAEKLHAYTRTYDDERSSRAKDLFDMLVIADEVALPHGDVLTRTTNDTFEVRTTSWPPVLVAPPTDWAGPWHGFTTEYPLRWDDLDGAFRALERFWRPVFDGTAATTRTTWKPDDWAWV
ncbi:nucleotidyl transferase AbiEii/AbiGii toxin family protein [Haloechinothrix salitolerans]|uniref:Nucleotidyl transferase AbiEii/AbiGii toxin family protein n=1 Tax=Haloechinothrix salitolerans TaxID=926830 RepID=A0ABW2BV24_9PSEU